MSHTANIHEIFSSLQGEGPHIETPMTFVRFSLCDLGCKWCDTPEAAKLNEKCRVESPPRTENFIELPNPISATRLNEILFGFEDEYISITGGEPLIQYKFLAEWLPTAKLKKRILLETSGIHAGALEHVISHIHVISMDLKLPSSTGLKPLWNEHAEFLKTALSHHTDTYVKIIVTHRTTDKDLQEAIRLISNTNKYLPVVIQPASPTLIFNETISTNRLKSLNRLFNAYLPNVKVIPQMHKEWHVL